MSYKHATTSCLPRMLVVVVNVCTLGFPPFQTTVDRNSISSIKGLEKKRVGEDFLRIRYWCKRNTLPKSRERITALVAFQCIVGDAFRETLGLSRRSHYPKRQHKQWAKHDWLMLRKRLNTENWNYAEIILDARQHCRTSVYLVHNWLSVTAY